MANEKKTSRKKFRVAVSGSTVDGREISPVHLREAAENFNPDVYAARVNVEHYLSPCPSPANGVCSRRSGQHFRADESL